MNRWEPNDVVVLIITLLIVVMVVFAVGSVYTGVPYVEGRAKDMLSLVELLLYIVAMYVGSKLKE